MKRRRGGGRRRREGGFALLLVFLMAAVIGITLYMELPRLAFDVQRQKEQLLIERGQQYQIAIRRYMQRGLRQGVNQVVGPPWPSKIEDLEDTNGRRFLRKRYLDPMTGKDEWRIIHINNGVLTDSINNKQQQKNQQDPGRQGGITEFAALGQTPTATTSGMNAAASRRRASDSAGSGGGGPPGDPNAPVNPGIPGGIPGVSQVPVPLPGAPNGGGFPGGGSLPPGVPPGMPPGMQYPGQLGNAANSNNPGGSPPFPQPGTNMNPGQVSPQSLINGLLMGSRPGGMPTANPTSGNNTIGGGIAGVASKLDDDAIMVCGDHTNYTEWEFIFDPSKWKAPADPRKTVIGTPAGSGSSTSSTIGPGMNPAQPNMGASPSTGTGPSTGSSQNPAGGQQGANQQNAVCGMEARPGIQ